MCVTIVDIMFADWLLSEMSKDDLSQAELARRSGLTKQAIGNYIAGRIPDERALRKIARGLKLPPEEVFRVAGLLPPIPASDTISNRAAHLLHSLKSEASKQRAIDYLELLIQQEERENGRDNAQDPATEPR